MKYRTNAWLRDTSSDEYQAWPPGTVVDRDEDLSHVNDDDVKMLVSSKRLIPLRKKKVNTEKNND